MSRGLRVAHCSDIHLDADYHEPDHYRRLFARALAAMCGHEPDVILLAGDLFDANDASDETIRFAMAALAGLRRPVVMIPGNHDCLAPGGIFERYDFNAVENVRLLLATDGETCHLTRLGVSVWGKGMLDHSPAHRPLDGAPPRPPGCRWYLGMGHGIYVPAGQATDRSSPVPHEAVAASPFDYLALGHHHAALVIEREIGAAAYCGSPTDSLGPGATYIVVDLDPTMPPAVTLHTLDGVD